MRRIETPGQGDETAMIPVLIVLCVGLFAYIAFFIENRRFVCTESVFEHEKVKTAFRIVQVSDLHDGSFGRENAALLDAIAKMQPDLILITGDLFNRRNARAYRNAMLFCKQAVRIAPTYFAEGNHECSLKETGERFLAEIERIGIHVLQNAYCDLPACRLIGLKQYASPQELCAMLEPNCLNIALAHRPELFPIYAGTGVDLVLSGHAHGGQIRLFHQPLYAPGQGFFPRYTSGFYQIGRSTLFVSRGLGNTIPFPRVFDTPELCMIEIRPKQKGENRYVCKRN